MSVPQERLILIDYRPTDIRTFLSPHQIWIGANSNSHTATLYSNCNFKNMDKGLLYVHNVDPDNALDVMVRKNISATEWQHVKGFKVQPNAFINEVFSGLGANNSYFFVFSQAGGKHFKFAFSNCIWGDTYSDNMLTASDAVLLSQYLAGWKNLTIDLSVADINGDGKISASDVVLLQQYLSAWNVHLGPALTNWESFTGH
jgi:hypothetical protein